jgi:hypothetical protein
MVVIGGDYVIKKKSKILSAILGFVLGPLSPIYFGFPLFIFSLIAYALTVFVCSVIFKFYAPAQMWLINGIFYAIYNLIISATHNAFIDDIKEDKEVMSAVEYEELAKMYKKNFYGIHAANILDWLLTIYISICMIINAVSWFKDGNIIRGILTIIFLPIILWIVFWVTDIIKGLIGITITSPSMIKPMNEENQE